MAFDDAIVTVSVTGARGPAKSRLMHEIERVAEEIGFVTHHRGSVLFSDTDDLKMRLGAPRTPIAFAPDSPAASLAAAITRSSRDWSKHATDAWIYGIAVGWDDAAIAELGGLFCWTPSEVSRLRRMRAAYVSAMGKD